MKPLFKKVPPIELLSSAVGIGGGIGSVAFLTYVLHCPLLIASFGASAVLLYAATSSPLAQPRNLIGGHAVAALVGATCYLTMGETWYAITVAVVAAILLMMVTDTLHPPGGATAIVTVLQHGNYLFVLFPVLAGALILLLFALLANRISPYRSYPHHADKVKKLPAQYR
ncbi:MAG: HPP family protein [Firmicutes bacterium]|nr:HPP family protein [Bacillota bacterium]